MGKELSEHEGMIWFGVISRESDVFIHVESYDVLESVDQNQEPRPDKHEWKWKRTASLATVNIARNR